MIGKTVSHYRITRQLGAGGMGVVYEAVDTKLDRTVALKFLPPESTRDPEAKARFVHEAKAASALDHPNVCTVFEVDETDDGQLFLAMACYDGETLKERIARGPLPLEEALDITRQVAEGLAKAHECEIVHRDIKPANLFITTDGLVKILDFGLAKLAGQTLLTKAGTTLGTAGYMSPEQAQGADTDHRTDLWCLGAVLFEMVTGRLPFPGEQQQAVLYAILNEELEPASGLRTGVPLELERIIGKCLAKDPRERYQHADDLLADLRHLRRETSQGLTATQPISVSRSNPGRRWPLVLGIIAAAVVCGFVALQFIGMGGDGEAIAAEPALAVVEFRDLTTPDDLQASAGMTELVNIGLIENSPIRVVSPEYMQDLRRRLFGSGRGAIEDDQILEVARKAGATLLLAGRMGHLGDEQFVTWRLVDTRSGESVEARKVEGRRLTVLVDQIVAGVLPVVAEVCGIEATATQVAVDRITTDSPEAYRHFIEGKLFEERVSPVQGLDELEKAVALDPTFALAHLELGRLLWVHLKDKEKAQAHLDIADSLKERLGSKDRLRLEAARYDDQRQFVRSVATYEEILKRWPDDREVLNELRNLHLRYWNSRGNERISQQGLKFYPDDLGTFGSSYAQSQRELGLPRESLRLTRNYVRQNPSEANAWDDLGWDMLVLGYPDSADVAFRKVAELDPSWFQNRLSASAYCAGDLDLAITRTERFMERAVLPKSQRNWVMRTYSVTIGLSALYRESGQYQKANQVLDEYPQVDRDVGWAFGKCNSLLYTGHPRLALEIAEDMPNRYDDTRMPTYSLRIRTRAAIALGDIESARRTNAELYAAKESIGMQAKKLAFMNEGEIALVENDPAKALEALDRLFEQGLGRYGMMIIDCRDAQACAHRMAGRLAEAAAVHIELLRIYGGHALSHYELGLIYEEMKRSGDAGREFERFLDMWSNADEGLPQLEDARSRLATLKSPQ